MSCAGSRSEGTKYLRGSDGGASEAVAEHVTRDAIWRSAFGVERVVQLELQPTPLNRISVNTLVILLET